MLCAVAAIITLANGNTSACRTAVHQGATSEMVLSFPRRLRYTMRATGSHGLRTEPGNVLWTSGEVAMTFDEILAQVLDLLQRERRLSYRALKVRFGLDEDHIEALKDEIIEAKKVAVDENNRVLVWTGDPASAPSPATTPTSARVPVATIPTHLAEKILTTRHALEGERKQVTGLFADLKDSTELIRGLD